MPHAHRLAAGLTALVPLLSGTAAVAAHPVLPVSGPAGRIAHVRDTTVTSDNWAGFVAIGGPFTSVTGSWVQPAVKCGSGDQYSSFWVGLDGYSSPTVEQTGTEADCIGGSAQYSAWYEMYPAYPVTYTDTVKAGDAMTASVVFSGTSTFTLTIKDATEGWTKTTVKSASGDARSSAECIVEAPDSGGVLPLADFGKVNFSSCLVNGASIGALNPIQIQMTNGIPLATTSPLAGSSFSVTWNS